MWRAASSTPQQRKNLLRILVSEVTLTPIDVPMRATRVQVLWESGVVTEHQLPRARYAGGARASRDAEALVRRLVSTGAYDKEIADTLNHERAGGRRWTEEAVARLRLRLGVSRPFATPAHEPAPDRRGDGLWSSRGVARRFAVKTRTVSGWVKLGVLVPVDGGGPARAAWFDLDDDAIRRVEAYLATSAKFHRRGAS
ncbi:MAG: hypothetical protein Q8P41_30380 [Pseudomonadota bacterium]|nr:hypothetical protein [Pseudomonadota bacterium]